MKLFIIKYDLRGDRDNLDQQKAHNYIVGTY